ncbi:ribose-phosphate pyrophosphokinase-like domain-containing protein [Kitasatospora sp. NPDC001175]|uniref:ribose-phosphate pyrophosphokinase-like domain-containing protein n=1 Tax=Kitasatospora sp. NPDC001175 TaxID=3157103 RepID=UPI003D08CC34
MTSPGIIAAACRAFTADFPGQVAGISEPLGDAGWQVKWQDGLESRFPDGELCIDLPEDPAGRTVLLWQSVTGDHAEPDVAIMSLLATARCYREHGAGRIVAVLPHLAYARHDRHVPGQRRPVMAALLAGLAAAAGITDIVTLASGAQDLLARLFTGTGTRLTFLPVHELHLDILAPLMEAGSVLVAPDRGAADHVGMLAAALGVPVLVADKRRTGPEQVAVTLRCQEDLRGLRHAVIVDDLITSAATVENVAWAIRDQAVDPRIDVVATHLRLTPGGAERLTRLCRQRTLHSIHTTDSAGRAVVLGGLTTRPAIPRMAQALAAWLADDTSAVQPERRTLA